jgi:hypothetical protein
MCEEVKMNSNLREIWGLVPSHKVDSLIEILLKITEGPFWNVQVILEMEWILNFYNLVKHSDKGK